MPEHLRGLLLYKREAILRGELWRLWTGHWVHFGGGHLFWDLFVFVVAATWLEQKSRAGLAMLCALVPALVSAGLLAGCPELAIYGGMSGLDTCLATRLGVEQLRAQRRLEGWGLLLLVAAKILLEYGTGASAVTGLESLGLRSVPAAHLLGAISGLFRSRKQAF
jgi:rhomboid family GlyGly-CTERM serine protease